MQKNHKDLLSIIKTAFTGDIELDAKTINYDELFNISKKHQIVPLVFQGLYKIVGELKGHEQFSDYAFRLMCHDQNQLYWLNKLQSIFSDNSIDHMLLKGSSIKGLYPSSEMRLMGDIDILIREEQYPVIREALSQSGLIEAKETDHELIWKSKNGILIELHKKLIPSYDDDYYAYYSDSWSKATIKDGSSYKMSVEDEYIYIFTHLTKHYRDGGIGLRHIIDVWFFKLCHPEINMSYIESELMKIELNLFHKNILDTIDVWFNNRKSTALTDYITERIIESGSYGIKEKWDAANAARLSAMSSSVSSAKRKNMTKLIFMPYSSLKLKYPILERAPFLFPVMLIVRWVDALINKRNNISRQIERSGKIEEHIVDGYTKELEMVGLKFDLKKQH